MIEYNDLKKPRTPKEFNLLVENELNKINSNKTIRQLARIKKGKYKKFIEEVIPFNIFFKNKFTEDYVGKIITSNQGYDAIITNKIKNENYYVEITFPTDGKIIFNDSKLLNENDSVYIESNDDFKFQREQIINKIIETANKKALIDYNYEKSILILVLSFWRFTSVKKDEENQQILNLINILKNIKYKVKSVYLIKYPENYIYIIKENI